MGMKVFPTFDSLPSWFSRNPTGVGWVGFQIGPDQTLAHECLSQNVKVMTYVAMLALCVFVWYVSCHCIVLVCLCAMFQQAYRTKVPLRINEVLTPKACLTLLAYTLISEEPYSVHPFFVFTLPALLVKSEYIDHYIFDLHWVRHGNLLSDRVSAEGTPSALYSPMHSRIFDSILLLYVHNPNALRLTKCVNKEGKIDLAGELTA